LELDDAKETAVAFLKKTLVVSPSDITITFAQLTRNKEVTVRGTVRRSSGETPSFEIVYDKNGRMVRYITSCKVCWNPDCDWNYDLPYKTTFPAECDLCPHCKSKLKELNEHP
jgi:hypothetical protein